MPFEGPIQKLKEKGKIDIDDIFSDFYLPIFNSKSISALYFMPNWKSSKGANWEYQKAKELGIEIKYI